MGTDVREVCAKTFLTCLCVAVGSALVNHPLSAVIPNTVVRWTIAFELFLAIVVFLLSVYWLLVRTYNSIRKDIHDQIRPAIRDRVLNLAFEGESWSSSVPARGSARKEIQASIAHALTTLKASGRRRVAQFAMDHGFVAEWERCLASGSKRARKRAVRLLGLASPPADIEILSVAAQDKEQAIRAEAWRALAMHDQQHVDFVFRSVLRESLLVRALLADDLKRQAPFLLAHTVPALLRDATILEIAHCFDVLISWKRALVSFDISPWLSETPNSLLWSRALALLPYVFTESSVERHLRFALASDDIDVQCAAAQAAGHLKQDTLLPELAAALKGNRRFALASACAIAQMGEQGRSLLETLAAGHDRDAARVAMEALEQAAVKVR